MSTKNKILVILTFACILLIPITVALAKGEPVYLTPFNTEYTVSSKDEVVIRYGWAACSKGLVNDYIDSLDQTFYFDGVLLSKAQANDKSYWSLPQVYDTGSSDFCLWDVDKPWASYWVYSLGRLEPGDHELVWERTLNFAVVDGGDYDGDGAIDSFQGSYSHPTTVIHVLP